MADISQLQERLRKIDDAIDAAIETGAQYAVAGSHSATPQTLDALNKQRGRVLRQIRQAQGIPSRTVTRFS